MLYLFIRYAGHQRKNHKNHQRGFTLIEMLITVAIISIIAGIGYPSYMRYVESSLRTDGKAGLLQAASELERCYSRQYTYTDCTITPTSPDGNYTISADSGSVNDGGFLITATASRSDGCASDITLNALGERLPEACW
ncbi:type IV pilin protein [Halomonas sp. GFAJ-1]|uniref:type IV pilin protein n=1 Tax=Halomonas sp. GFAJ-1 TaxID=1118153 RepID=UPI00023A54C9|nr:type IV pilin protein [Halomonas sp. GFAJ-1]EHK61358.1 methylation site containing protein [Halomonas sp. GFAJ-1]